jgi:hypothetical protein
MAVLFKRFAIGCIAHWIHCFVHESNEAIATAVLPLPFAEGRLKPPPLSAFWIVIWNIELRKHGADF